MAAILLFNMSLLRSFRKSCVYFCYKYFIPNGILEKCFIKYYCYYLMGNDKPKEREVGTVAGLAPSPSERVGVRFFSVLFHHYKINFFDIFRILQYTIIYTSRTLRHIDSDAMNASIIKFIGTFFRNFST